MPTTKPTGSPSAIALTPEQRERAERISNLPEKQRIAAAIEDARRRRVELGLPPDAEDGP